MTNDPHTFAFPSGNLAWYEAGDPAGLPLFYFHGWPASGYQGIFLDACGKKLGIRIISPDRPGIGASAPQPGRSFSDWPQTVAMLADHLGLSTFRVMGVSGGCPYSLHTAAALPDRVLAAATVCGPAPLTKENKDKIFWAFRLLLPMQKLPPRVLAPGFHATAWLTKGSIDRMPLKALIATMSPPDRAVFHDALGRDVITTSFRKSFQQGVKWTIEEGRLYDRDWNLDFLTITVPVRLWHGGRDKHLPAAMSEWVKDRLPNAHLTLKPEDGHFSLPIKRHEEILRDLFSDLV
jgi:pimeloyl-ACP methyl ester carboxylesterase